MIYLLLRAMYVPMLHDSIATFFRYVHIHQVFPYYSEWSANNHFLNSLLMLGSYELFGSSPFALKLPNVIFFPVYFFFAWKISGKISNPFLKWGFLISMLFAHNFFEFFGTGRGYGMSMGLVIAGVWFVMLAHDTHKTKHYFLALILLSLATYANLTIMNSFILLVGELMLILLFQKQSSKVSKSAIIILFGIIPIILMILLLFKIQAEGELYYGKPDGFIQVSVATLSRLLTGSDSPVFVYLALLLFLISAGAFIFVQIKKLPKKQYKNLFEPQWFFLCLLTGNIIAYYLEHKIFGTNYPEDRTGLFLYPWLVGSVFFSLDAIKFKKPYLNLIPALPFLFFPIHFITHMNLSWSSMENQAIPERFHITVAEDQGKSEYPLIVQGYQGRLMRWLYMNFRNETPLSRIFFEDYPSMNGDYQIVNLSEYPEWRTAYDSIDGDQRTGFALLKRKNQLSRIPVFSKDDIQKNEPQASAFFELYRGPIDSLAGKALYIDFNLNLSSEKSPFHGRIVADVQDDQNNSLLYEFTQFDWYRTDWSDPEKSFLNALYLPELPEKAQNIVIYIWNIDKKPFLLPNGHFDILYLRKG